MKRITIKLTLGLLAFSSQYAHAGSYLFCLNPTENKWTWPKVTEQDLMNESLKHNNITVVNKGDSYDDDKFRGGIWLKGKGLQDSETQHYLYLSETFNHMGEARNFCQSLINKCQDSVKQINLKKGIPDDSKNYTQVGASTHMIPGTAWGIIQVGFHNGTSTSCPNWNPDYKNYTTVSYWQAATVFGIVVGTGAGIFSGLGGVALLGAL